VVASCLSLTAGCSSGDSESGSSGSDAPAAWTAPEANLDSLLVRGSGPEILRDPLEGDWGHVVAQIRDHVPRGGLVQSHPGTGSEPAFVVLRQSPDAWVRARLSSLPADTRVYYGAKFSQAQLSRVGISVHDALREQATYVGDSSGAGELGTRVVVTYGTTDGQPLSDEALDAVLEAASESYPDHQLPVPVDFVHDPDYVMPVLQ
jgi:hypothetical protein